ncbi:MAG: hypothetical protein KDA42_19470 [Planctomycetales bacterium]|nr:hypothetical protein [Planctomycetales bacterium]
MNCIGPQHLALALFLAALSSAARAADEARKFDSPEVAELKADLNAMQGRWAREYKNAAGAKFRVEKLVEGNQDTVTHLDANGNIIHAHRSDFKLERAGAVKLYTFSNSEAIAGPNLGARREGPRSFLYRIENNTMYEVWGLTSGDASPLAVLVWKREPTN